MRSAGDSARFGGQGSPPGGNGLTWQGRIWVPDGWCNLSSRLADFPHWMDRRFCRRAMPN